MLVQRGDWLRFNNETPIYLQLFQRLALDIVTGKYSAGEKIPSVRELSVMYKVNPNTVQKALSELEDVELIYTERTNGKFVTEKKETIKNYLESLAQEKTIFYINDMKDLGYSLKEVIKMIEGNE